MKIQIISKIKIGKWAALFTLLFILLMGLKILKTGIRIPFPTPVIAVFGVIGFILGIISIFKNKDRSVSVFLSIPVGLLIIFWTAAEILFPH